ncbi:MAG: hypothetical protein RLN88_14185 [Ekhidna sp.]|uniref:hypothetical protein n=1 Tax=Ekhidna sp. TaxID=2608089 RepID=UPI0032F00DDE
MKTPKIEFVYQQITDAQKQEVINFWVAENALNEDQARKRVDQIALIARGDDNQVIGVSTMAKRLYEPIGKTFWVFRAFVAEGHRQQGVVLQLISEAKEHLNNRFNEGKDSDVIGILLKVQSPILMKHFPQATWPRTQFHFVGIEDGCHIRISYFDGAKIA